MKSYLFTLCIVFAFILGCKTGQDTNMANTIHGKTENEVAAATANDTVRIANDSLEYEIIIIDPGFNSWLQSRAMPRNYYGQVYLENKNRFWVTEWNIRVNQPQRYGDMYQMSIDYHPDIDYGYEVNYLLFNYLVYFQVTNRQRLGGIIPQ
ncbi:hypothetical protein GR160_14750 [Flavobacterium sp. Sd200]|uniref:DUF6146 family protein n=1 Tax=Flavobacterium sp. Sd200 TaxID=2692211 RepID=UPI00136A8DFF|nr:DUF6146 family protein [Flavobacterium sp. Sd200]MXN92486.1 hypothetical protein [Flavobacterium sp. Sd200]